jgi:hypothetical protein
MNFINKVHGTSYAPHKKTAGKLNTSVPTSNVFISNLDTLFQNSQQISQNKIKTQKHVILESNFYTKWALHLLAVLAKEYAALSSRMYPKSLKKERNKM